MIGGAHIGSGAGHDHETLHGMVNINTNHS